MWLLWIRSIVTSRTLFYPPGDHSSKELSYGIDLTVLAQQQKKMTQWTEQHDDDSDYEVINGLLYLTRCLHRQAPYYHRLVLPPQERQEIITRARRDTWHMSVLKTLCKQQETFMWPGNRGDIKQVLSNCPICLAFNSAKPHVPITRTPMEVVAADVIDPLVESPDGTKFNLTLIDHKISWGEAYRIKNKTSLEVWVELSIV